MLNNGNFVFHIIIGVIIGIVFLHYARDPIIKIEEKIVEKFITVEQEKIVKVPVKEKVIQTKIVYIPEKKNTLKKVDKDSLYCLALNIYREANNQSIAGMIAVGRVVINRVNDRRFPDSVCGVIYEGPHVESWKTRGKDVPDGEREYIPLKNRCQFSWYCDGRKDEPVKPNQNTKWQVAEDIAYQILAYDRWKGMLEGATHYHADYVKPSWGSTKTLITKIDNHIFYRWE
jgi:N-acetylmuramoyl-L-alanine amidase